MRFGVVEWRGCFKDGADYFSGRVKGSHIVSDGLLENLTAELAVDAKVIPFLFEATSTSPLVHAHLTKIGTNSTW